MISNKDKNELETAAKDVLDVVVNIYNQNILKVNSNKTSILQVEKNTSNVSYSDRMIITIHEKKGHIIKARDHMKVLGVTLNSRASMDTHLSQIKSKIGL